MGVPEPVKRILRREVGFGCPICRSPFLTWHHFAPPRRVLAHDNPEGMIALCREHHDEADQGHYSPDELRQLKNSGLSADTVKGDFPSWMKASLLVRVGGSYIGGCRNVIAVEHRPIIRLTQNEAGLLSLSFVLSDARCEPVAVMEDNAFEAYPDNIHDMFVATRKGRVKVWLAAKDDIGLDLSFRRLSLDELEEVLETDRTRAYTKAEVLLRNEFPGVRELISQALHSDDPVGRHVKSWAEKNCMCDDLKIPFVNFESISVFLRGERIVLKDGLGPTFDYCAAFDQPGAFNLR